MQLNCRQNKISRKRGIKVMHKKNHLWMYMKRKIILTYHQKKGQPVESCKESTLISPGSRRPKTESKGVRSLIQISFQLLMKFWTTKINIEVKFFRMKKSKNLTVQFLKQLLSMKKVDCNGRIDFMNLLNLQILF